MQDAVDIVQRHLGEGATAACEALIQTAVRRWGVEDQDYRDDVRTSVSHPSPVLSMATDHGDGHPIPFMGVEGMSLHSNP